MAGFPEECLLPPGAGGFSVIGYGFVRNGAEKMICRLKRLERVSNPDSRNLQFDCNLSI